MRPGSSTNAAAAAPAPVGNHSPWHSPLPYLFGGLAAMLGLIAFALLVLACSYWKLSGYMDGREGSEGDPERSGGDAVKAPPAVFEEKILVIMAGEEKPTYLATPSSCSSRASSFDREKGKQSDEEEETTTTTTVSMGREPSGRGDPP